MPRQRTYLSNADRQRAYRVRLQDRKRNAQPRYDSDEWYTPPEILELVRAVLGGIDLDPASCLFAQRAVQAARWFDKRTDGLAQEWNGRVFMNPPYSSPLVSKFTAKLVDEYDAGRMSAGICVVNNATDTRWFKRLFARFASCFTGRLRFYRRDRKATQPRLGQVFFYLGPDEQRFAEVFATLGRVVPAPRVNA